MKNHRQLESRIHARLAALPHAPAAGAAAAAPAEATPVGRGSSHALDVLVPVDGSRNSLGAARHAIDAYRRDSALRLHLLNVQSGLQRHAARFAGGEDREGWLAGRADAALAGAVALLDDAGVPHHVHRAVGNRAEEICHAARQLDVQRIVLGTARKRSITRMLEDSVTHDVLEMSPVPVEVVTGDAVSPWERWGVPVAVAAVAALLLLAAN
ncbi:MAG: universal stress protein [Caldimonas sp.]